MMVEVVWSDSENGSEKKNESGSENENDHNYNVNRRSPNGGGEKIGVEGSRSGRGAGGEMEEGGSGAVIGGKRYRRSLEDGEERADDMQ